MSFFQNLNLSEISDPYSEKRSKILVLRWTEVRYYPEISNFEKSSKFPGLIYDVDEILSKSSFQGHSRSRITEKVI